MEKHSIAVADLRLQPFTTFDPRGVLLVSGNDAAHANPMTISWGMFGIMWGKPVMMVMVRRSRYTWNIINTAADFTVNWMPDDWADALRLCGSKSGRDLDKFTTTGMIPIKATTVASPIIDQSVLSLECRTLYRTDITPEHFLDQAIIASAYSDGDLHDLFFGEIVAATGIDAFVNK